MDMMALAVVFLLPAYYLAKSKGYNVLLVLVCGTVLGIGITWIVYTFSDAFFGGLEFIIAALTLLVIWLLPQKEGAPGKRYLKITFDCPECRETVSFARRYEGRAELCPQCGEILTVPLDEFSAPDISRSKSKPTVASGPICFNSFGDEMVALQMQTLFEGSGIASEIMGGTAGGALPQLSGTEGFKVMINVDDWDKAVEIEQLANAQTGKEFS